MISWHILNKLSWNTTDELSQATFDKLLQTLLMRTLQTLQQNYSPQLITGTYHQNLFLFMDWLIKSECSVGYHIVPSMAYSSLHWSTVHCIAWREGMRAFVHRLFRGFGSSVRVDDRTAPSSLVTSGSVISGLPQSSLLHPAGSPTARNFYSGGSGLLCDSDLVVFVES